ncbi:unnamed protein product, partial [Ascophyllum nodosum]
KSTWKVLPRSIQMHIVKEMGDDVFWERLLQDKSMEKTNVKIDWNKFVDEDEDEVGAEGFDMSALDGGSGFGGGGMPPGGMGGMPGMGMGGMMGGRGGGGGGGMPAGMEEMMAKMKAGGMPGGLGGMGGMGGDDDEPDSDDDEGLPDLEDEDDDEQPVS